MNEQALYTGLLKGVLIGRLAYANHLATYYSNWLEKGEIEDRLKPKIFEQLKAYYGILLEEEEEIEMEKLFYQSEKEQLITFLQNLEIAYNDNFLNSISKRRKLVETIYSDISNRTNFVISDAEIHEIKKAESTNNASLAGEVWKKINKTDREAIDFLCKTSRPKVSHFVLNNSGNKANTDEILSKSTFEFLRKLEKMPKDKGYYQWLPVSIGDILKTSIFTYFLKICMRRWIDMLRSREKEVAAFDDKIHYDGFYEEFETTEFEEVKPSPAILKAIRQLPESCYKIIAGKYFGGTEGIGLTSKELSQEIGYAVGYINNKHRGCLDELREILNADKSN